MTFPDAMKLLTEKVNEMSQAKVAEKLGYSPAAINTVLKGTCPNPDHILQKVIEVFGGLTIDCPELRGEITLAECAGHRKREPTADSFFARMYRACKYCKNNH